MTPGHVVRRTLRIKMSQLRSFQGPDHREDRRGGYPPGRLPISAPSRCRGRYQAGDRQPSIRHDTLRWSVLPLPMQRHGSQETVTVPGFQTWPSRQAGGPEDKSTGPDA